MKRLKKIPCIVLVGGKGTRYSEINEEPKQLIKIYKKTLIENLIIEIKKSGITNFIFPLGYKKKYFHDFFLKKKKIGKHKVNLLFSRKHKANNNHINLRLFDAGKKTSKLTRIQKSLKYVDSDVFFVTYGDGLSNIDLVKMYKLFTKTKNFVIACSKMKSQYGHLSIGKSKIVNNFHEKPILKMPVNIGYYLFNKTLFNKFYSNNYELETSFLKKVIKKKKLISYLHKGFFFNIDKKIDLLKIKNEYKKIINLF